MRLAAGLSTPSKPRATRVALAPSENSMFVGERAPLTRILRGVQLAPIEVVRDGHWVPVDWHACCIGGPLRTCPTHCDLRAANAAPRIAGTRPTVSSRMHAQFITLVSDSTKYSATLQVPNASRNSPRHSRNPLRSGDRLLNGSTHDAALRRASDAPQFRGRDAAAARTSTPESQAQDCAHAALSLLRFLGIPARYVAGYLVRRDSAIVDAHAWIEAYLPWLGWGGIDLTTGQPIGSRHVSLAVGRSALDVVPLVGGHGGSASQNVCVTLRQVMPATRSLSSSSPPATLDLSLAG